MTVRAVVNKKLSVGLRPFSNTPDSWHFYRHNFAACGVTEWEMLEAIALTDKTKFTVHWLTADFQTGPAQRRRAGSRKSPRALNFRLKNQNAQRRQAEFRRARLVVARIFSAVTPPKFPWLLPP